MIDFFKSVFPADTLLRLIICGAVQLIAYYVPKRIKRRTRDIMVTRFDRMIKQRPWWIFIYVLSFAQWFLCYWAVFRFGRSDSLPEGPCAWALNIIYRLDAPTNLFPSMHCSLSMICLIMLFTAAGLPLWLKAANAVFSLCVFMSTLKTKQHVIVDTLVGMLLGALCCLLFLSVL